MSEETNMPHESTGILSLPCELVVNILRQFDHIDHLLYARLACRHINDSYMQHPSLSIEIVSRQIGSLAPHAVAAFRCSRKTATMDSCRSILAQLHHNPAELQEQLHTMTFEELAALSKRHDIVWGLTTSFATSAWTLIGSQGSLILSNTEEVRFCSAFYRFDLVCGALRARIRPAHESRALMDAKRLLLWPYAPWVNEQVGCVYDFLEMSLMDGIILHTLYV